jgi:hypothetical protein
LADLDGDGEDESQLELQGDVVEPDRHDDMQKVFFCFIFWCALAMLFHDSSSWKLASLKKRGLFCHWLAEFCKSLWFCGAAYACVRLDEETCFCHLQTLAWRLMAEGGPCWSGGAWVTALWRAAPPHRFCQTSGPSVPGYLRHCSHIESPIFPLFCGMLKLLYN